MSNLDLRGLGKFSKKLLFYTNFSIFLKNFKNHGHKTPELKDFRAIVNKMKNLISLFRDFLLVVNQINHVEFKNRNLETTGATYLAKNYLV